MIINGFNSDDYRYFFINKDVEWNQNNSLDPCLDFKSGTVVKIRNDELLSSIFNSNFYNSLYSNLETKQFVEYPKDQPFNFSKMISMQKPLEFKFDGVFQIIIELDEAIMLTPWLEKKMNSDELTKDIRFKNSIKETNISELSNYSKVLEIKEINESNGTIKLLEFKNSKEKLYLQQTNSNLNIDKNLISINNQIGYTILQSLNEKHLFIPFKKGETWNLANPSLGFLIFRQNYLKLFFNSTEILGKKKEELFIEEYKDNVENKNIRYYKIKENFDVENFGEICSEFRSNNFGVNFSSFKVRISGGNVEICEKNRDNYENGFIKYFYVEYQDSISDRIQEQELLKIASRLDYEEANKRYKMDLVALKNYEKEKRALEYVKKNITRYKKGSNRLLTPVEFMEQEENKLKQESIKRLVKCLNERKETLQKIKIRK